MAKKTLSQRFRNLSLPLALLGLSAGIGGCRVSKSDVTRWGSTEHGPDKLVAVITHDRYEWPLRIEAGLELLRMKPRNGRRIGITRLVEALAQMSTEERSQYLQELIPGLTSGMKETAPSGNEAALDPSIPFKDGVMAILTYDKVQLVADDANRKQIIDALIDWCMHDFERRLDNTSQMFGMEQVVHVIGDPVLKGFPSLITIESTKYDRIATLIADTKDQSIKEAAGAKLVELAKYTSSNAWADKAKVTLEQANEVSKNKVSGAAFQSQLQQYQDETLTRVLAALKKVGSRVGVEYCLGLAGDKGLSVKRRQAALAALEGRLDRNSPSDVDKVLAIASDETTPDEVRDFAFQRVGEVSRDQVVSKLYGLFASKKWKVRWVAAETVLKMSNIDDLAEFMSKLPSGLAAGFAIGEPLKYGDAIEKMQPSSKTGKKPRDAILPYLNDRSTNIALRLTALGYFYSNGKQTDLPLVEPLATDKMPTPKIDDKDGRWQCEVAKPDGKETELRDVRTIGEFVTYCIEPAMKGR